MSNIIKAILTILLFMTITGGIVVNASALSIELHSASSGMTLDHVDTTANSIDI